MTDLLNDVDAPSDAELISRVRGGDVAAYGDLFARHVDAAKRLSRQLVRGPDADDLVSEAFAKVLTVLQGGGGPDVAFRAYLLTSVRRLHVDRIRSTSRLQTSDDMEAFDPGVPFQDTAVAAFESGAAAKAFASLPERWQLVLWHLEVEGQKPADVAPLLGMSPNSVSALAYRAREGLRQAFLTMHLNDTSETDCRWVNEHLGAYVRNGLAKRESAKVQTHLDDCRRCTAMYLELTEVNSNLRGIIAPLLLGAAATGYLASSGAAAGGLGLSAAFGRVRDAVSANAGVATAGAIAAGVAAVATAAIVLLPSASPDTVVGADSPVSTVSTPPGAGGSPGASGDTDDQDRLDATDTPGVVVSSPAAVLPSALPGTTDGPTPDTAPDPGSTDGTTGPGNGSSDPGTEPTEPGTTGPTPTEPTPTEPTPTEPTPTEPTPTEPSPTEPTPTEPTPTEPTPTEPTPTEPTPTEPPPPVVFKIVAGPATVANDEISFDLTGDPLPPQVFLTIDSEPAGITFAGDGTCKLRLGDTTAICDTSPDTALVAAPFARTVTTAAGDTFSVTMPLSGTPPEEDTELTVTLAAPEGVALETVTAVYDVAEPAPSADVSLSAPSRIAPDRVGSYSFDATIGNVPDGYAGGATISLGSETLPSGPRAWFAGTGTAGCTVADDGLTLTCDSLAAGAVVVDIAVEADVHDNSVDTPVTLTLAPLDGLEDPNLADNSATVVLEAFRPSADASVGVSSTVNGNSGKGDVTVTVGVDPEVPVRLEADFDRDQVEVTLPDSCEESAGGAVCRLPGSGEVDFGVSLVDRAGNETRQATLRFAVTVPGHDDPVTANDATSVTVARFETEAPAATSLLRQAGTAAAPLDEADRPKADTRHEKKHAKPKQAKKQVRTTAEQVVETLTSLLP